MEKWIPTKLKQSVPQKWRWVKLPQLASMHDAFQENWDWSSGAHPNDHELCLPVFTHTDYVETGKESSWSNLITNTNISKKESEKLSL